MNILWVNHASFVIESGSVHLLVDPWISGTAFNDSWELLVPSRFEEKDFNTITHIWFSHEHPDHFAPPVLSKIPEETRRRITVLFQETRDRRVVNFCRKLGFGIQELTDGKQETLAPDFFVTCGKVPFYDSWLACRAEGATLLDLNDCVLETRAQLKKIRDRLGPVEVLLGQFSYASWFGNANQPENYREAARAMKEQLLREIEVIQPRYTIPCASFVRFCHVENRHMNDCANRVGDIVREIERHGKTSPVVLFPGDRWTIGAESETQRAIQSYEEAANLPFSFRKSETVSLEDILSLSRKYHQKILERNDKAAIWLARHLGMFPGVSFYVEDLKANLWFDWASGLRAIPNTDPPDVRLSSESLAYLFRFDWGLDTLQVSARFTASKAGFRKLVRTFGLGSLNNMGLQFGPRLAMEPGLVRRAILKVARAR